ncbi:2,3-bisphosphoglycerate-independent phosphoglycerate mutase [Desulfatiferula olefinivorans]
MDTPTPVMLMILDGWGINPSVENNAVAMAETPHLDRLFATFPHTRLVCSGPSVGLPEGIMGNSEVGHLNIGAGRTVYQTLLRIDRAIEDRSFFTNPALTAVMTAVKSRSSVLHIMGLVSDGGVHSQMAHLFALLDMADGLGLKDIRIHVILDGRDTPPDSGAGFVEQLCAHMGGRPSMQIAGICGRYYAMDRDTRWDRTETAFRLYTEGEGLPETDPVEAVRKAYARGETDEFVKPMIFDTEKGLISDHDGVIFFNYRADRARQITRAFTEDRFKGFVRTRLPHLCDYVCMAQYDEQFDLPVAFGPLRLSGLLGEVVSRLGLSQLRIAETEKYAHVTYFFNGGEETPFPGEDRCLIPSPRDAATYDLKPQMSACEITDELIRRIHERDYALIVVNYANMDMVGHTGVTAAAVEAVETVDACVGRVVPEFLRRGGTVIVTADHGNSEQMVDAAGKPHTAHTLNPVPLILVSETLRQVTLNPGCLADIAPTVLAVMGLDKPEAMTGRSLIAGQTG